MRIDLGDATLDVNLRIPGLRRHRLALRVGVPFPTTEADRVIRPNAAYVPPTEGTIIIMDLAADMQVDLSVQYTDEVGNPTDSPAVTGASVVYSVDDPNIINLTDNGDGTAVAAAVGTLGAATVHVHATTADGGALTGDLQINVVAGLAERINIVAGTPTEVTPDTPPTP